MLSNLNALTFLNMVSGNIIGIPWNNLRELGLMNNGECTASFRMFSKSSHLSHNYFMSSLAKGKSAKTLGLSVSAAAFSISRCGRSNLADRQMAIG